MTDEYLKEILKNRDESDWCDTFLRQIDNEARMKIHFERIDTDGYSIGNEKEIKCPDWLRKAIFEAVDAHKIKLDERFKEL